MIFAVRSPPFCRVDGIAHTERASYDEGMLNLLDNLDVFYGELTPARATVYARLEGQQNTTELSLSGFVRGPRCFYSNTLQSTSRLEDAGPGPSLLAKGLVIDPCYWSPETPNIYDVTVELRRGKEVIASEVRQIGFKPLGISGRFFTWEGKPWVLRGVNPKFLIEQALLAQWRICSAVMVLGDHVDESLLARASEEGVLCFVCIDKLDITKTRSLARYPAVAITHSGSSPTHTCGRNLICSQYYAKGSEIGRDVLVALGDSAENLLQVSKVFSGPIMATREGTYETLAEARAACDKLQADLAPFGQFAGYFA